MAMPENGGNDAGASQVNVFYSKGLQVDALRAALAGRVFVVDVTHPGWGRTHGMCGGDKGERKGTDTSFSAGMYFGQAKQIPDAWQAGHSIGRTASS